MVASAIAFAMPSDTLRCITTPCALKWPHEMAAATTTTKALSKDMIRLLLSGSQLYPHALLHQRLHYRIFEVARDFLVRGLHHEDPHDLFLRVDPEMRAKCAIPSVAAVRNAQVRCHGIGDDLHAQAESTA